MGQFFIFLTDALQSVSAKVIPECKKRMDRRSGGSAYKNFLSLRLTSNSGIFPVIVCSKRTLFGMHKARKHAQTLDM